MKTYRAIGFDYGGVLGGVNAAASNFADQACLLLGIDKERFGELYFSLNHLINQGEVASWREFWVIFLEQLGKPELLEQLVALDEEAFQHLTVVEKPTLALVDQLRKAGYKVGLLSNATIEDGRWMRDAGLHEHFDAFLISAEIKVMKPDPLAFEKLALALGVEQSDMIFIDNAMKSLSTAETCGFTPVLFTSHNQLVEALRRLGIEV